MWRTGKLKTSISLAVSRGAVGETTFHVCFLMGTPTHMYIAKRMLKWYPKLLHDVYLSEVRSRRGKLDTFSPRNTTARMSCTWAAWRRTPL
jgi:hypothetical protein